MADILTPCYIKRYFLQQIRTTDKAGNELPDGFYQPFIDGAIAWLAAQTDLVLSGNYGAVYTERKDSFNWSAETFYLTNLNQRPIASITELAIQLGNFEPGIIPLTQLIIRSRTNAVFQIPGGPGAYILPTFSTLWGYGLTTGRRYDAGYIRLAYTVGFVWQLDGLFTTTAGSTAVVVGPVVGKTSSDILRDVQAGHYIKIGVDPTLYRVAAVTSTSITLSTPAEMTQTNVTALVYAYDPMLLETAGMFASLPILELLANYLYGGPAIAGRSLSVDSRSQAKPFAIAPGRGVYAAMQQTYQDRIQQNMDALTRKFQRLECFVV